MRVLILGAGASICAGYPKADELLDTLAQDVAQVKRDDLTDAWKLWREVIAGAPEKVKPLLKARNPEILLTFLDLCEMYMDENFEEVFPDEKGREAAEESLSHDRLSRELFSNAGHAWLHNASTARDRLIFLLGEYFTWRAYEDSEHPSRMRKNSVSR